MEISYPVPAVGWTECYRLHCVNAVTVSGRLPFRTIRTGLRPRRRPSWHAGIVRRRCQGRGRRRSCRRFVEAEISLDLGKPHRSGSEARAVADFAPRYSMLDLADEAVAAASGTNS